MFTYTLDKRYAFRLNFSGKVRRIPGNVANKLEAKFRISSASIVSFCIYIT